MIARIIIASLIIGSAACSSPTKDAYVRVAREANPILTAMKPAAAKLLAADPDDHRTIIEACMSVDEQLWLLRQVKFDNEHIDPEPLDSRVSDFPEWLLDHRSLICKPDRGIPSRIEPCSRSCLENWKAMIEAVERLRDRAKEEGVEIVSLRPR